MGRSLSLRCAFVACVLALAGCSGPGENWHIQGEAQIQATEFFLSGFQANKASTLHFSFNVTDGPSIDLLTLDEQNLQAYQAGTQFSYVGPCSRTETLGGEGSCDVGRGRWYVILDNTEYGRAKPPADAAEGLALVTYAFSAIPK